MLPSFGPNPSFNPKQDESGRGRVKDMCDPANDLLVPSPTSQASPIYIRVPFKICFPIPQETLLGATEIMASLRESCTIIQFIALDVSLAYKAFHTYW